MTYEELNQYRFLVREQKKLESTIESIRSAAQGPGTANYSGAPKTPGVSDRTGSISNAVDLEPMLEELEQRCGAELLRLETYIASVEESRIRLLLRLRFVDGLPWGDVAREMGGWNTPDSVRKMCSRYIALHSGDNF